MNYRALGRTGLKVSEFSLGSWTTYGGSVDQADADRIVHRAFELGVNLFDTADVYVRGAAETVLGHAIRSLPRGQLVIATKCMGRVWEGPLGAGLSRKHIFDALDASLRRLQIDYVDLYQLHAPDLSTPIEETVRAFEDLVRSGKVRYVGFSNYDHQPQVLAQAVAIQQRRGFDPFISSQPRYNLREPRIEKDHMPFCRRHGIGIICYSPLLQGVLTNKYAGMSVPQGSRGAGDFKHFLEQEKALTPEHVAAAERVAGWVAKRRLGTPGQVALAWVLRRPEISSAIIGATSVAQLEENLGAGAIQMTAKDWTELEKVAGTDVLRRATVGGAKAKRAKSAARKPAKRAPAPARGAKRK